MSKLRDKIQIQDQDSEEVEIDLLELFQYFRSQILILIIALLAVVLLQGRSRTS